MRQPCTTNEITSLRLPDFFKLLVSYKKGKKRMGKLSFLRLGGHCIRIYCNFGVN